MTVSLPHQPYLIIFDGYCNLCSSAVQFILKRDRKKKFRLASLQGAYGKRLMQEYHVPDTGPGTFLLIGGGRLYTRSTGALRVVKELPGLWPLLYVAIVIPPFIRDSVYDWVARHRYQWFGKRTTCWMPQQEWKDRFLD